ncbi:lipopolysaccharide-induced tumor necrosis factor-alpha factor homolog isoform X2 [Thrips palmi]|nr:lipopolysaccharide-induced tumor necrosis factor-alpha factor homolog isoform X2 [Thrips palmi]
MWSPDVTKESVHQPPPMMHQPHQGMHPPPPVMHQPPPAYAAAAPAGRTVTIIAMPNLSHNPAHLTCPTCNSKVVTDVEYVTGTRTHAGAIVLCMICCCLPGLIPYCCDSCKTAVHTCPVCKQSLGVHEP